MSSSILRHLYEVNEQWMEIQKLTSHISNQSNETVAVNETKNNGEKHIANFD
jgi:hypothetical protein